MSEHENTVEVTQAMLKDFGPNDEQIKALTAMIKAYIPEGKGTFELQIIASNDGEGAWTLLHQSLKKLY